MPKCSNRDLAQISRSLCEFCFKFRVQFELIFEALFARFWSTVNAPSVDISVFGTNNIKLLV